ncbi:hypothetical protein [Streptomyces sp. NPDC060031]|uniref:hypothetical protein n=1 Tax=Streptomyces sp. NPDC060031 TaxID=3347043 RepID=UPI00367C3B09
MTVGEEHKRPAPPSLRTVGIGRRVHALFRAMSADPLLREQFVTDPAQILCEYVGGHRLSPQRASVVNQLVYSVASDPEALRWLRSYAMAHRDSPVSRDRFMADLGRAVAEKKSVHVVLALLRFSLEGEDFSAAVDESLVPIINDCGLFHDERASGTEMSTGTQFGTEVSGTQVSTTLSVFAGHYVPALEALVEYSVRLRDRGVLESVGGQ